MGLMVFACISSALILALSYAVYLQRRALKELTTAYLGITAKIESIRQKSVTVAEGCFVGIENLRFSEQQNHAYIKSVEEAVATSDAYAKSLNERQVLLEIEKQPKPAATEDPVPSRRSFASQKARAEAGARK